jgi:hypothetical protein
MEVLPDSVFGTSQHNSLNLSHKRNDDWIGGIFYTEMLPSPLQIKINDIK